MNNYKLVSFDFDGTLTHGVTSLEYCLSKLNKQDRGKELEEMFRHYQIDIYEMARKYAEELKGVTLDQLKEWIDEIPRLKNIGETVKNLKDLGFVVGITSIGPRFITETFKEKYNFDFVSGSTHEFIDGVHTGKMLEILTPEDKDKIVKDVCSQYGIDLKDVIAIGDGRGDIPVFNIVGYTIALNADDNLKEYASEFLQSDDLMDIYLHIKSLM